MFSSRHAKTASLVNWGYPDPYTIGGPAVGPVVVSIEVVVCFWRLLFYCKG